jgi:prevent-host-death family protein
MEMKNIEIPVVDFKRHLSDYVGQSQHGNVRVIVTKHRKPVAAVVSMNDLHLLEAQDATSGLASIAGKWSDFSEVESTLKQVVDARSEERGRDVSF